MSSVSIRPDHTRVGVPQWRHNEPRTVLGAQVPAMSGLTLSDGTDYDLYLPDSVWLTVYEDLQEHFAQKKGQDHALADLPRSELVFGYVGWLCHCGEMEFSFASQELATAAHAKHAKEQRALEVAS